jgi:hypothetical protein
MAERTDSPSGVNHPDRQASLAPTAGGALRAEMARSRLRLGGSINQVIVAGSPSRLLSQAGNAVREKAAPATGRAGMAALAAAALAAALVRRRLRRRALARSWPGRMTALVQGLVRPDSPWWGLIVGALTTYAKRR